MFAIKCTNSWSATNERVEQCLQSVPDSQQTQEAAGQKVEFYDTIHKNNAPTFDKLYQIVQAAKEKGKSTILRAVTGMFCIV